MSQGAIACTAFETRTCGTFPFFLLVESSMCLNHLERISFVVVWASGRIGMVIILV